MTRKENAEIPVRTRSCLSTFHYFSTLVFLWATIHSAKTPQSFAIPWSRLAALWCPCLDPPARSVCAVCMPRMLGLAKSCNYQVNQVISSASLKKTNRVVWSFSPLGTQDPFSGSGPKFHVPPIQCVPAARSHHRTPWHFTNIKIAKNFKQQWKFYDCDAQHGLTKHFSMKECGCSW